MSKLYIQKQAISTTIIPSLKKTKNICQNSLNILNSAEAPSGIESTSIKSEIQTIINNIAEICDWLNNSTTSLDTLENSMLKKIYTLPKEQLLQRKNMIKEKTNIVNMENSEGN